MKTTIELSDELFRKVKAEAALRGRKLKDLVEEGAAAGARNPTHAGPDQARPARLDERFLRRRRFRRIRPEASQGFRPCPPRSLIPVRWSRFWTGPSATTAGPWSRFAALEAPLLVCEPVLAEAMYLLSDFPKNAAGAVRPADERRSARCLSGRRAWTHCGRCTGSTTDRPISLSDACVVRMAELFEHHHVFTLDSDFSVYRKNGREPLTLIYPPRG